MLKRYITIKARSGNKRRDKVPSNLFGIILLVSIMSGIALYLTNARMRGQVYASYCGDFGFYGKSLILMKNGIFYFNYSGCSQNHGRTIGEWQLKDDHLTMQYNGQKDFLATQYLVKNDSLIAPQQEGFFICEHYLN